MLVGIKSPPIVPMKIIKIYFDNEINLHIALDQNKFVDKWTDLLAEELITKNILQIDTFSSFFSEEESKNYLICAINTINNFLKTKFIDIPTASDFDSVDYYNYLHIKFEKLVGSDWSKPTRLVSIAPPEIRTAIRHINRFCHRLERRPYTIEPMLRIEFDSHLRKPLAEEDYKLFEERHEENRVYLDYSTLGKSLSECYEDNLSPHYHGLKMQEHYCANFLLKFGKPTRKKSKKDFKKWIQDSGIDHASIKNHGHIPLGYIVEENLLHSIINCRKIKKITLE
jgi:hypothetical protein